MLLETSIKVSLVDASANCHDFTKQRLSFVFFSVSQKIHVWILNIAFISLLRSSICVQYIIGLTAEFEAEKQISITKSERDNTLLNPRTTAGMIEITNVMRMRLTTFIDLIIRFLIQKFRSVLSSMHVLLCNLYIFHKVRKYKTNVGLITRALIEFNMTAYTDVEKSSYHILAYLKSKWAHSKQWLPSTWHRT